MTILHRFLGVYTGSLCAIELFLKYCIGTRAAFYDLQTSFYLMSPWLNYSVAAPELWNKLPLDIRLSSSVTVFKTKLKTYLFTNSFDLKLLLLA